jgi:hypothetical protein
LLRQVADADQERDRYNRLHARGKLSDGEYDLYVAETEQWKAAAEAELERLRSVEQASRKLDDVPRLVDEFLQEFAY